MTGSCRGEGRPARGGGLRIHLPILADRHAVHLECPLTRDPSFLDVVADFLHRAQKIKGGDEDAEYGEPGNDREFLPRADENKELGNKIGEARKPE